jgi:hypothetical protein
MRPEEDDEMQASETRPMDNNTTGQNGAGPYPLETLMALQKLLQDGIPEQGTHTHQQSHPPSQATSAPRQAEPPTLGHAYSTFSDTVRHWADQLRSFFMRGRKSKTAGKGNSAQQRG